jgi:hypothetical protein
MFLTILIIQFGLDATKAFYANKLREKISPKFVHRLNEVAGIALIIASLVLIDRLVTHFIFSAPAVSYPPARSAKNCHAEERSIYSPLCISANEKFINRFFAIAQNDSSSKRRQKRRKVYYLSPFTFRKSIALIF